MERHDPFLEAKTEGASPASHPIASGSERASAAAIKAMTDFIRAGLEGLKQKAETK
jgi:hypothetical protein